MGDKKGTKRVSVNLDQDVAPLLDVAARERGVNRTELINLLLRDSLTTESKMRTLVRGQTRLRAQVDDVQQSIYTMFKAQELFFQWVFTLMGTIPKEQARERQDKGEERFERFVEEFLRRNNDSGMPIVIERLARERPDEHEDRDL